MHTVDSGNKAFVVYFDVPKAFDTVWIDGLFYQMREMGIKGRLWRILYFSYVNFNCRVAIPSRSGTGWNAAYIREDTYPS